MTELQQRVMARLKAVRRGLLGEPIAVGGMSLQSTAVVFWSLVRAGHVVLLPSLPLQWQLRFDGRTIWPLGCAKCNKPHFCAGNTCDGCKENT